jgi:hypothetical protein
MLENKISAKDIALNKTSTFFSKKQSTTNIAKSD